MNRVLWMAKGLLAAFFAFTGFSGLITLAEIQAMKSPFPVAVVRFIGVCEIPGPMKLILPLSLRIRPKLTVLAMPGPTIVMVGTTLSTSAIGPGSLP